MEFFVSLSSYLPLNFTGNLNYTHYRVGYWCVFRTWIESHRNGILPYTGDSRMKSLFSLSRGKAFVHWLKTQFEFEYPSRSGRLNSPRNALRFLNTLISALAKTTLLQVRTIRFINPIDAMICKLLKIASDNRGILIVSPVGRSVCKRSFVVKVIHSV